MPHPCPVCAYPDLREPARRAHSGGSYEICPSCGFQFGVSDDDRGITYAQWRRRWRAQGMQWSSRAVAPPADWYPATQLGRLRAMAAQWKPVAIIAEANAMGGPLVEQLQRENLPVMPFLTTNASKAMIIEGLALALERGEIRIPNDPVIIGELQAYEQERLPGGTFRYGAPAGVHDDIVMSLALAWHGTTNSLEGPVFL